MRNIEAESWLRDMQLALRGLLRQKATAVGVLIILTLGVGVNLVTFQLVDQLLLQPPAHLREPARLVRAALAGPDGRSATLSYPGYEVLGADSQAFAGSVGYMNTNFASPLVASRDLRVTLVTPDYFTTLGVSPVLGRLFGSVYGDPPEEPVAVLSYGLWKSAFGSSRGVIGKVVRVRSAGLHRRRYCAEGIQRCRPRTSGRLAAAGIRGSRPSRRRLALESRFRLPENRFPAS